MASKLLQICCEFETNMIECLQSIIRGKEENDMKKILVRGVLIGLILSVLFGGMPGAVSEEAVETPESVETEALSEEPEQDGDLNWIVSETGEEEEDGEPESVEEPEAGEDPEAWEEAEAWEEEEDGEAESFDEPDAAESPEEAEEPSGELTGEEAEESEESPGGWRYEVLADQTAAITGFPYAEEIVFPAEIDGRQVSAIFRNSRDGARSIVRKVVIPEGVTTVGEEAFAGFYCMEEVQFPSTLKTIEKEAFARCALTSVNFPEGLEEIGDMAFEDHEIKELVIPAGVKKIGNAAFNAQGDLPHQLTFLGLRTELGIGVFGYTPGSGSDASDPEIPESESWDGFYEKETEFTVRTISLSCYRGGSADLRYQYNVKKTYLKWGEEAIRTAPADRVLRAGLYQPEEIIYEIVVPEGVEEIADGAFAGLTALSKVRLPSTLKSIGARAFEDCLGLQDIQVPASVTSFGSSCFRGCTGLAKISVPKGTEEIPAGMFADCRSLRKLELPKSGLKKIGYGAFENCISLTSIKLSKDLEEIGATAFMGAGVEKITVPNNVTKIGKAAFARSAVQILILPKGMTEIPEELCYGSVNLRSAKIPDGVTRIGDRAFTLCRLSKLTLPEGLISIGEEAFRQDSEGVEAYLSQHDILKPYASLKSLKLPASLQTIGKRAFAFNDALTKLTFAKGTQMTEIGEGVFEACMRLTELKVPDSVKVIGVSAFANCAALTKVDLGNGVTEIRDKAFMFDRAIRTLTAPDTLVSFGEKMLEGYSALTVICSEGSATESWVRTNCPNANIIPPGKKK